MEFKFWNNLVQESHTSMLHINCAAGSGSEKYTMSL
jgi:hypothetical protein